MGTRQAFLEEKIQIEEQEDRQQTLWKRLTSAQKKEVTQWVLDNRPTCKDYPNIFRVLCLHRAEVMFGGGRQ